jgi:CcmD family protein
VKLLFAVWVFAALPAAAQEDEPGGRATSFERATDSHERVPGGTLLVAAYAVIWVLLFGFVVLQYRRAKRIESEVDRLTKALRDAGKDGGSGGA